MPNSIAFAKNYTSIIDEVYQRAGVSNVLNSGRRMVRAGHNAKEIMIPKISVTGLGDYTRNVGYKTGAITYEFETKTFNYDRGIRLFADVMDVEEAGVLDCFVEAGAELQRTQVAPEADAFTFAQIAGHTGVTVDEADLSEATATDVLAELREVTSLMDEAQVSTGSRYLFITPTLKGVLDDYIPASHVIGTDLLYVASGDANEDSTFYELKPEDKLVIDGKLFLKNQKTNKATMIQQEIGRVPVLAFGNSTGDFSMATYTLQNDKYGGRAYMLLCNDTERDYGDPEVAAGFKEKCDAEGFYTVSMKDEFTTLYPEGAHIIK